MGGPFCEGEGFGSVCVAIEDLPPMTREQLTQWRMIWHVAIERGCEVCEKPFESRHVVMPTETGARHLQCQPSDTTCEAPYEVVPRVAHEAVPDGWAEVSGLPYTLERVGPTVVRSRVMLIYGLVVARFTFDDRKWHCERGANELCRESKGNPYEPPTRSAKRRVQCGWRLAGATVRSVGARASREANR